MYRFGVAAAIWIVIVGGMAFYMEVRRPAARVDAGVETHQNLAAADDCSLEVTTTFDLEPDPFALQTDDGIVAGALVVRLGDQNILARNEARAGEPILVASIDGLKQGVNEFYLEATSPLEAAARHFAVRVRVLCGDRTVTDRTIWSDQGGKAAGTITADLSPSGG